VYDVKGMRGGSLGGFILGLLLALVGLFIYAESMVGGVVVIAIGGVMMLSSGRGLISSAPQVRATDAGVSFSGGPVIPWSAIKQIYVGKLDVQVRGYSGRTASIAIDFHHRRTMFRLPVRMWLASPLAVGDVDVSPAATADRPDVIVAKLEAMRQRA
jgi:hypothetical protein